MRPSLRFALAALAVLLGAGSLPGRARAQTAEPNWCGQFPVYHQYLMQSTLDSFHKSQALLRLTQAEQTLQKLRSRRDWNSLNAWCKQTLLDMHAKEGQ